MRYAHLLCWTFCLPIASSFADTPTFKCTENGKTIYSQTPCNSKNGQLIDIKTSHPTAEQQAQAMRDNQHRLVESNKLQKARERLQAQDEARARAAASKAAYEKKQCDAQKLRVKWADEDLSTSNPRRAQRMQTKFRRAQEKMALACNTPLPLSH